MEEKTRIVNCLLDAGELLFTAGAEAGRVEDTLMRMARAYGFVQTDVMTITASVIVTLQHRDGEIVTQMRRIKARDVDLHRVECVNALSRAVCAAPMPVEQLETELRRLRAEKRSEAVSIAAYLIVAFSCALFFGGSWRDGLAAMPVSLLVYWMQRLGRKIELQPLVLTVLCAIALCAASEAMVKIGLGQHPGEIIIANIMLLIPGLALTNALRDMIAGDTISGLFGLCEALLRALAIAAGCAMVLMQMGGG